MFNFLIIICIFLFYIMFKFYKITKQIPLIF